MYTLFFILLSYPFKTHAEGKKVLSSIINYFSNYDTLYISPNRYKACTMLLCEQRYSVYTLSAQDDTGNNQELTFSPQTSLKMGPYVGYSLLFLGYTINIGMRPSNSDGTKLHLSLYTKPFGIDCNYESNLNNYRLKNIKGFNGINIPTQDFSGMNMYLFNLYSYFIFNNKKFSYPAAYNQSTNQRRNAGSFIAGFNYTHTKVKFDYTKLPAELLYDNQGNDIFNDNLKLNEIYYRNYSLSFGYSYNWVFARNCLANITLTPTLGYNFSRGERFNASKQLFKLSALNFDLVSRSAIVWNNSKFFAGISVISHTYSYKKPTFSMKNAFVTTNIYAGFNFWKKKAYK